MGLYTRLASDFLFPLHERLKGHDSVARRRALEASQWLPMEELRARQLLRLREFLAGIAREVPYYADLFKNRGFDPDGLHELSDLAALPLLDKSDIRAHAGRMKSRHHGPLTRYNTGGSSGQPLVFYIGKGRKSHDVAAKWRATRWWDVDIGDREAVIWGSPIEHGAQDRLKTARDAVFRSTLLPAFEMSAGKLEAFVHWIRRHRPRMLFGYPSALQFIARHARERGVRLDDLGIKVAFVTSERLYDEQRTDIRQVFGCPVANGYGGRDAGFIAHECPHGGMHLSAEDIVVETIDAEGRPTPAGVAGEIVVTHMATTDFPFVRYRTGDIGVLSTRSCACGRGLPLLEELQGRTTDFVVAQDGTVMHGLALIYTLRDLPGIEQFRIEQLSVERMLVQIVPGAGYDARAAHARISHDFKARLGGTVDIEVTELAHIPAEKSGKYRYVVSHVARDAGVAHA